MAFSALFVGACSKSATAQLEIVCKKEARLVVYDAPVWQQYLAKVLAKDIDMQRKALESQQSGAVIGPPDKSPWIAPFPYVPGFDWQMDKPRSADTPQPGNTPERNDIKVLQRDRIIARLVNFHVVQHNFGYSSFYSCANRFPDVYRIARSKVLA